MISHLRGLIYEIGQDFLVLDVQGVGFKVSMPTRDLAEAGRPGDEVGIFTEMVVREDFLGLYGFNSQFGRQIFNLLCSVNGIGPKIAMSILSVSSPEKVAFAISVADAKGVTAPGVGKKLADRIILELKAKVTASGQVPEDYGQEAGPVTGSAADDALKALISLGYTRTESDNALRKAIKEDPSADAGKLIRIALGTFAGMR